ncbi:MAG: tryptophan synthase subunit alpha [Chloroflexota bacterium]
MLGNPIIEAIQRTRQQGRMALCGYFLAGYPSPERFYQAVRASRKLDVIEYGIPTDDPALDGPVISNAHEIVTRQRGVRAETALVLIGGLAAVPQPRFVMTYTTVGRQLGGFLRLCVTNDVHGVLVPDIQPDEGTFVATVTRTLQLAPIMLLDARADDAAFKWAIEQGDLIYLKASPGPTGSSADLDGELGEIISQSMARLRAIDPNKLIAVGIGIRQPGQIAALAALDVDMAIVGTRIIEYLEKGEQALVAYIESLHAATTY